ncbi:hypothetical protein [Chryseobacterium sp. M5A1_1a]
MKQIIYSTIICLFTQIVSAQVAIAKENVDGNNTILDFNSTPTNTLGLILPAVDTLPALTASNNGTFLFDKTDKMVKMYEKNGWVLLSDAGNTNAIISNSSPEIGRDVIIGAPSSSAKGILVLESNNKALILPKISNPHISVKSPYPGMLCYDTVSKSLAVFDGINWNYWK